MNAPSVCLQLKTVGNDRPVSVQLVAAYDDERRRATYLLLVNGRTLEIRATHLQSRALFAHTLVRAFGVRLEPMSRARWAMLAATLRSSALPATRAVA